MNQWCRTAAALLFLGLACTFPHASLEAQGVTTSAVGGRITDAEGAGLAGAQVTLTNTATGAVSTVATRADGRYFIPGLQPGNYRLQVSGLGFATQVRQSVNLALGQSSTFDFTLAPQAVVLEGITVTAEGNSVISSGRTGASAVVTDSTLRRSPTITRDLQDFTRLVPQMAVTNSSTGAVSGGGRNNRFNQLQIDGTASNDLFGLSASGSPSGQAGAKAITLEAIQELQVVLAPFDVRQNGFTGASVNAVTRSGTNRFQGSAAGFHRNQGLVGSYPGAPPFDDFDNTELALSVGGPIVRDRAFFFLAGETTGRTQPVNVIAGSDASAGVTMAQADELRSYLESNFGYDAGTSGARNLDQNSRNLFGRLDFNLGQNNRLTVRHNYIKGDRDSFARGARSYFLGNAGYIQNSTTNSSVLQLNSAFANGLFNELRIGYNRVRDFRGFDGGIFPRIEVQSPNGSIIAGTENFSGQNVLDQDALEITNDLTIPWNAHTFTVGTSNEFGKFSNLFVRNPFGNYRFSSIDDLRAGTPNRYEYSYLCRANLPNCTIDGQERAEFGVNRFGLYVQDRWEARSNLQLTFGIRGDLTSLPDDIAENPLVAAAPPAGYGRSTSEIPGTTVLFNPRVGFNWDVTNDGTTQVRGGAGTFSGRAPYVWISNAYGNTGLDYVRFTCTSTVPAFSANPDAQPLSCAPGVGAPAAPNEINLIDPNFKLPQVARYSLAIDRVIPFGLIATVEGLYTQTINDILYRNLR
ncbi:MAG TPA: carboxypeptidase regulatory-like domain-containing protein, partial [Vicinamibacterales bacterium]|nr:carboxypeptidase regulatory-like domain-containing protein [Vicinamibacterales bacterium]